MFINIDIMVSDLIDVQSKNWNSEKINDLFYPEEAPLILRNGHVVAKEDFWVWRYNKNGDYTVK